jgi:hypothetical protein
MHEDLKEIFENVLFDIQKIQPIINVVSKRNANARPKRCNFCLCGLGNNAGSKRLCCMICLKARPKDENNYKRINK